MEGLFIINDEVMPEVITYTCDKYEFSISNDDKTEFDSMVPKEERAILVGLEISKDRRIIGKSSEGERSLDELEELANTAGVKVLGKMLQKRSSRDSAYYIGKGKVEELNELGKNMDANVVIFDNELSGIQIRNIEEATGMKVIDRTALILDIFAQRAQSREGKLQVELALLKYRLPRLTGMGGQLSRLGGGIGTRGPGEKKLETDRRHIRRIISSLENELKKISNRRMITRQNKQRGEFYTVALVGYTNAGKSTLMNRLCGSDVFVEDKLFATLDPTTRKLTLEDKDILFIDTVGFIRKLPTELINAFRSTLEEAVYADVLVHVVDVADEEYEEHINVVNDTLKSLGVEDKPVILAFNKIDLLKKQDGVKERIPFRELHDKTYDISAATGEGIEQLIKGIEQELPYADVQLDINVPYNVGWVMPYVHENGKVLKEEFLQDGIKSTILIDKTKIGKIREFINLLK